MLSGEVAEIRERFKRAGIGLKDALAVIDMTLDDQLGELTALSPYEVFRGLNKLIDRTVHGTKIERFRPQEGSQSFQIFEIRAEGGDVLGYLNMIYLRKPIPFSRSSGSLSRIKRQWDFSTTSFLPRSQHTEFTPNSAGRASRSV